MAFSLTTLSAAVGRNDTTILLTAITNVTAGSVLVIDKEIFRVTVTPASATTPVQVLRGQEGSAQVAHVVNAQVKIGATPTNLSAGDFTQPEAGSPSSQQIPTAFSQQYASYSAAGAITLPSIGCHMLAILNGTGALAMTIANPSTAQDGSRLVIAGNGKAAHTVTYAAGLGNVGATADVITFAAAQAQSIELLAVGGFWVGMGMNTAVAGAGATINGVGLG